MEHSKTSTRIGLFALLVGVIMLSLFGSLVAANRALASADQEAATFDARGAALAAERDLRFRAEALNDLVAPLLPATRASATTIDTTANSFDAVWVVDTTGRIAWRRLGAGVSEADTALLNVLARTVVSSRAPAVRAVTRTTDS